jgi:hypothetical protein
MFRAFVLSSVFPVAFLHWISHGCEGDCYSLREVFMVSGIRERVESLREIGSYHVAPGQLVSLLYLRMHFVRKFNWDRRPDNIATLKDTKSGKNQWFRE